MVSGLDSGSSHLGLSTGQGTLLCSWARLFTPLLFFSHFFVQCAWGKNSEELDASAKREREGMGTRSEFFRFFALKKRGCGQSILGHALTQVYKWVPANLMLEGNPVMDKQHRIFELTSGEVEILLQ